MPDTRACVFRPRLLPSFLPPHPPTSPPSPQAPFHPFAHRPGSRRRRRRRAARPPPRNPPRPAAMAPLRPHRRGRVTMPAAAEGQPPRATGLGGLLPWMCAGEAAPQKCSNSGSSSSSGRRRPRAAAAAAVYPSSSSAAPCAAERYTLIAASTMPAFNNLRTTR